MLDINTIKSAIKENDISVFYSFYLNDGKLLQYKQEKAYASSPFMSNLYSDRLKLTLGPVVRVLQKQFYNPKYRFKATNDCVDLRKSSNTYEIKPKESIIILTNERIHLSAFYSALVFPRVSLSDVGIIVTPAYIDPYYDGLLRLHVTNTSDNPFELKVLEPIAQCFFFKFPDSVPDMFRESFSQKSVFFGQNWKSIISEDRPPFPTKKSAKRTSEKLDNIKYQLGIIWSFIKKHSLIFVLLANVGIIYFGYLTFNETLNDNKTVINQLADNFHSFATEIIIEPGKTYGEKEIIVQIPKNDILTVICSVDLVQFRIFSSNNADESKIVFSYQVSDERIDPYEVNFTYSVIRRISN